MKSFIAIFTLFFATSVLANLPAGREKLNTILDKVEREFTPDFQKKGWRLVVRTGWKKDELNAYANVGAFSERKRIVSINGEMMRRNLSEEAILWPICHELGHHFAGQPLYPDSRLSVEGQADYWAAQVCLPRLFKTEFAENLFPAPVDSIYYRKCETKYSSELDRQACARTLRGGVQFQQALFEAIRPSLESIKAKPSERRNTEEVRWLQKYDASHTPLLTTPDLNIIERTRYDHPAHQCRVDTLLAGVLGEPRPACWYKADP